MVKQLMMKLFNDIDDDVKLNPARRRFLICALWGVLWLSEAPVSITNDIVTTVLPAQRLAQSTIPDTRVFTAGVLWAHLPAQW